MSRPNANIHGIDEVRFEEQYYNGTRWVAVSFDEFCITAFDLCLEDFAVALSDAIARRDRHAA